MIETFAIGEEAVTGSVSGLPMPDYVEDELEALDAAA